MKVKGGHPRNTVYGTRTVHCLAQSDMHSGMSHTTVTLMSRLVSM